MDKPKEIPLDGEITRESLEALRSEAEKLLDELDKNKQESQPGKKAV